VTKQCEGKATIRKREFRQNLLERQRERKLFKDVHREKGVLLPRKETRKPPDSD